MAQAVEDVVRQVVADVLELDVESVSLDADFLGALEADSIDIIEMAGVLEGRFQIDIEDEDVQDVKTVGDLVRVVEART